jgi:type IV pilus assembly protein PilA
MKSTFGLLKLYSLQRSNFGFTLIELLVVVMIMGVLTAMSWPAFVRQIGKARESEAKINLGSVVRAQQAYHFEKGTFANTSSELSLNATFSSPYYTFPDPASADSSFVRHQADAINAFNQGIRNYSVGVYFNSGAYSMMMCQGSDIGQAVQVPSSASGVCSNNGVRVE